MLIVSPGAACGIHPTRTSPTLEIDDSGQTLLSIRCCLYFDRTRRYKPSGASHSPFAKSHAAVLAPVHSRFFSGSFLGGSGPVIITKRTRQSAAAVRPVDHEFEPPPNLVGHAALLTRQQHNTKRKT